MLEKYHDNSELFLEQLKSGVFITVRDREGIDNTMTIAWGHIGIIWGRPVFIAYVRYSRYTYDLLRNADDYTINVPALGTMKDALRIAGTKSGRDIDKFKEAKLTLKPAQKVNSPIIAECALQYECKTIYTQTQEPALIDKEIKKRYYTNHDTHIMFYGEILETYLMEDKN